MAAWSVCHPCLALGILAGNSSCLTWRPGRLASGKEVRPFRDHQSPAALELVSCTGLLPCPGRPPYSWDHSHGTGSSQLLLESGSQSLHSSLASVVVRQAPVSKS